jgi:hypothetical protein
MPSKSKPKLKPKGGASPRRQFVVPDAEMELLDRIAETLSPANPLSRSEVLRRLIREEAARRLSPPARRS